MKTMLACAAAFATLATPAAAEVRYDRKLEAAVKARVAAKIGDIRTGFDHGQAAIFLRLPDDMSIGAISSVETAADPETAQVEDYRALLPVIERRAFRIIF